MTWLIWSSLLTLLSCKKPFTPPASISSDSKYLVIEGSIVSNDSTFIRLSRTKKIDTLRTVIPEANAIVAVESDANATYPLTELKSGIYAVAPLNLDASHKYRLRVKTSNNEEYLSDFVPVKNSPAIDDIGFTPQPTGLQIWVNSHDAANATKYYRWEYEETWQFHTPYISAWKSNHIDSIRPRHLDERVSDCFASDTSVDIFIASTTKLNHDVIYQSPLILIPSNSEKIETKYSVLVKQHALTADAYGFWENLKKNTEKLGSIFDVLPSETRSNFHCISDKNRLVVGFLSVGNIAYRRIFITVGQLPSTYAPQYPSLCEIDTAYLGPVGHQVSTAILMPFNSNFVPIQGFYPDPDVPGGGGPNRFTFSTRICTDCTIRGYVKQPAFWK